MPDLGPAALVASPSMRAAPRVLQLGMHWFSEGSGGLDRVFHDLLTSLPDQGIEAFGLVEGPEDVESLTGGRIRTYTQAGGRLPLARLRGARRQIGRLLRSGRIDLVASHFALHAASALDLLATTKLVVHFHGPWAEEARLEGASRAAIAAKTAVEHIVYRRADRLIVLSEAFKTLVGDRHRIAPEKITVIPGSVDIERFAPAMSKQAAREALGWPQTRPILVAVRRLTNRMGLENLIACLPELVRRHPDLLLQIVGKGRLAEQLKQQAEAAGLGENIRFAGFLPDALLPLAYRAADINVVPSTELEGFGLTAAESLAAGTPSMVTPVGGLPEVVKRLSSKLVFRSAAAQDLAAGIGAALASPDTLPDETACLAYAEAAFAPSLAASRTAAVYREVVEGATRRARPPPGQRPVVNGLPPGPGTSDPDFFAARRTRVLFVNHTAELGGAELSLLGTAPHFGERCHVALFSDGPLRARLKHSGIGVTVIQGEKSLLAVSRQGGLAKTLGAAPASLRLAWRLAAMARQYDVLFPNSQKAAVVCLLAGALLRKPVVWYLHDILSASHFSALQRRVVVGLANLAASRVLVNSQASRDAFAASGGSERRVRVVFNGIDPAPFEAVTDAQVEALRQGLGVSGKKLVGVFGRLTRWKGQHILIEALPRLPDIHAIVVGGALFGEEDYAAALRGRADALGVSGRIAWLGFRDDVPALMRMVDVVLHTSVSPEPFGRVIVEAMLSSRPVLATNHGGAVELLGASHPHLVAPDDPDALSGAIAQVFNTPPAHLATLVESNRVRALAQFSASRMVRDIELHIAEAVG